MEEVKLKIPVRIVSEANISEHWTKKHKRKKEQQAIIKLFWNDEAKQIKPPAKIKLIRIAPRSLDLDNLVASFKHATDAIADLIKPGYLAGRADGEGDLHFKYDQKKGKPKEYALEIEIRQV